MTDEIENISQEKSFSQMFSSNFVERMHLCISVEGEHFEQLSYNWIYILQ